MKIFILLFCSLFFLVSESNSQSFTFVRTSPAVVYGGPDTAQLTSNATVNNTTSSTIPITIDLSNIVQNPAWDTIAFCTWVNCYPPGLVHRVESCGPGEHPFDVYISPNHLQGIASCRVTMTYQSTSVYQDFILSTNPIGIKKLSGTASEFKLNQNYPNPFNPSTKIGFSIPKNEFTDLRVYDVLGREVAVVVSGFTQAGEYEVELNANELVSGMYFYRLKTQDEMSVKKMILIK